MAFRSSRLRHLPTCIVAALALTAPSAASAVVSYPQGFEDLPLITGLSSPTDVAWTPDGRAVVVEKWGGVEVAQPGASTTTLVLNISGHVNSAGDRGLLGVAVDSAFATNHYVYLLYTYEVAPLTPDLTGPMTSRLTRITLNDDNTVSGETTLVGSYGSGPCPTPVDTLDCIPSDGQSHSIGTVRSAPDGTIYMGSGDAADYNIVDPVALRTYDERTPAGKILHVDRNGNGLPGHPMCPAETNLTKVCTKVYAKGFRNPFRFTLRPGNEGLAVGDVGWGTYEEMDLITAGGGDYGWPCYEGAHHTTGYKDLAGCPPEYAKEGTASADIAPNSEYTHTGSNAIVGGPEYTGDQYPSSYRGSIFFGDYAAGFIRRLVVDASNNVTSVQSFATGWSGVALETTPSGDVAYASFGTGASGTGSIRRIAYTPGNRAPVATATATPTSGQSPLPVSFDASGSSDPDGDPLSYAWDFGDGTTSTLAAPSHTYLLGGTYNASVTVSDGRGRSDVKTFTIAVGNNAPVPAITSPADGSLYNGGQTIALTGAATDAQDGALPASALSWRVTLHHTDHTHPMGTFDGVANPTFSSRQDHDADSYYEITLTARDSSGLTSSTTINLRPRTVAMTIDSVPAGAPISYAGYANDAPYAQQSAIGFLTSISTADQFVKAGRRYVFDHWSDGGTRLHDVTIPSTAVTYTATYRDAGVAGPVLALGFDEGTGQTTADATGLGGTGTISNGTWSTAGKFGNALSFNGTDTWVTVPDSTTLDLTSQLTIEAWVKPRTLSNYAAVLIKEATGDLAYGLYATDGGLGNPNGWQGTQGVYAPPALPVNAWSHLALTADGTTLRLYVDGVLRTTAPASLPAPATTQPLRIGGDNVWTGEQFDGFIDEVRLYDRALSATEIATDRDTAISVAGPPPPPPPDTTLPTVSLTAPAAGNVSGTSVNVAATASDNVGVQSVRFQLDGADLGALDTTAPYSVTWDTTTATNTTHTLTAIAKDAAGNTKTSTAVVVTVANTPPPPPTGPVMALGFDEGTGTTAGDSSGRGNAGTISGATWAATGKFGKALTFNGTTNWVTVPDAAALDLTTAMTVEAWVKPTTVAGWSTVLMKEDLSDLAYGLYAGSTGASRPNGWFGQQGIYGPAAISTTAWTHLALVKDATTLRLYVNGTLVATTPSTLSAPVTARSLRIGGNAVWPGEFFKGLIDEVRVYGRALTAAEVVKDRDTAIGPASGTPPPPPPTGPKPVLALGFDEGAGTATADKSGTGNNGAITGATWSTDARFGKALSFNGTTNWVTVPDSASLRITGPMTLEAWVKLRSQAGWKTILLKEAPPGNLAYALYGASSGYPLPTGWFGATGITAANSLPTGAWEHIAAVYDGTTSRFYVNGVQVASKTGAAVIPAATGPLRIGGNAVWGEYTDGLIDELRVYATALTANQISLDLGTPVSGTP